MLPFYPFYYPRPPATAYHRGFPNFSTVYPTPYHFNYYNQNNARNFGTGLRSTDIPTDVSRLHSVEIVTTSPNSSMETINDGHIPSVRRREIPITADMETNIQRIREGIQSAMQHSNNENQMQDFEEDQIQNQEQNQMQHQEEQNENGNHNGNQGGQVSVKELIENTELTIFESGVDIESSQPMCCSICQTTVNNKIVRRLKCSHLFHANCIDKWLCMSRSCPLCRQDVSV